MGNYADSKRQEHRALIRRYLVRYADATNQMIADALKLDKDYVAKHINKIRKERVQRMNRELLGVDLAKTEDTFRELTQEAFKIMRESENENARIGAIRTIADLAIKLFNIKFDAGVFERKLGRMDVVSFDQVLHLIHDARTDKEYTEGG